MRVLEARIAALAVLVVTASLAIGSPATALRKLYPELLDELSAFPRPEDATGLDFGAGMARDGDVLAIGAADADEPSDSDPPGIYVYHRDDTGWVFQQKLVPDRSDVETGVGHAIAIDGDRLAFGAPKEYQGPDGGPYTTQGAVYVFERDGDSWTRTDKLIDTTEFVAEFGLAVALSGDNLAVGCSHLDKMRMYQWSEAEGWGVPKQLATQPAPTLLFESDTLFVGQHGGPARSPGRVHIYRQDNGTWNTTPDQILEPYDKLSDEVSPAFRKFRFGSALAMAGTRLFVGAPESIAGTWGAGPTPNVGAVYIFDKATGFEYESPDSDLKKISPLDLTRYRYFGSHLTVVGDQVVVGSRGAVTVFDTPLGVSWEQQARVVPAAAANCEAALTYHDAAMLRVENEIWLGAVTVSGQPLACDAPLVQIGEDYSGASSAVIASVARELLFGEPGDAVSLSLAAFRFREELYGVPEAGDPLISMPETLSDHYAGPQFERSREAETLLANGLAGEPESAALRELLLDIYYNRTLAGMIAAGNLAAESVVVRHALETSSVASCNSGGTIDREICLREAVLAAHRHALDGGFDAASAAEPSGYFQLLEDSLGAPVGPEGPLGYVIFKEEVPDRALAAATHGGVPVVDCDGDGDLDQEDLACSELYSGYRDLALLLEICREIGTGAHELASLYHRRGNGGDKETALALLAEYQALTFTAGHLLLGVFEALDPAAASGIEEAVASWRQSLSDMSATASLIENNANPLGFSDDFMVFMPAPDGPQFEGFFNTYDILEEFLRDKPDNDGRPLREASERYSDAVALHGIYRESESALAQQLFDIENEFGSRLSEIVGAEFGTPAYDDALQNPRAYSGGEIALQYNAIDLARNAIARNRQEIRNLHDRISIEVSRRSQARGVQDAMQKLYLDYGEMQAALTAEIGTIEASQAAAEATADAVGNIAEAQNPFAFIASAVTGSLNVGVQVDGEIRKAELEIEKEHLAAMENAEIVALESELADIDSDATIKNWMLEMSLLSIDSQEVGLLLRQEVGKLHALINEKKRIEARIAGANSILASRYFADPIHRLRSDYSLTRADLTADEALRWIFFMARSLEYKWNLPFNRDGWDLKRLYSARNWLEIQEVFAAMISFNNSSGLGRTFSSRFDTLSLREDILGYVDGVDELGQPLRYADPDPASDDEVGAIEAFQSYLRQLPTGGDDDNPIFTFNTARVFPARTLFRDSRTLDKVQFITLSLEGDFGSNQVPSTLRYGGTSFIRTRLRPDAGGGVRPDRQPGELSAFSTRSWRTHTVSGQFYATEGIREEIVVLLDRVPPTDCSEGYTDGIPKTGTVEAFAERSVAATEWEFTVPLVDLGTPITSIDEIEDIELHICHRSLQRD